MGGFRRAGREQVNVFEVDDVYLFKHYFDGDHVFARLKEYYNNQAYRFEVPPSEFAALKSFLDEEGYGLVRVEDATPFVVVVRKYTAHPENIFKGSVIHRSMDGFNSFLMTDQESVEAAVEGGAERLRASDVENPF